MSTENMKTWAKITLLFDTGKQKGRFLFDVSKQNAIEPLLLFAHIALHHYWQQPLVLPPLADSPLPTPVEFYGQSQPILPCALWV